MPRRAVRHSVFLFAAFLAGAFTAPAGHAGTLRQEVRLDLSRLQLQAAPAGGMVVQVPGMGRTWEQGFPELPYVVLTLLVPQGQRLIAVHVAGGSPARSVGGQVTLQAAQPKQTDDGDLVQPRPARLGKSGAALYPAVEAEPGGSGALHGYQLASVRLYPVRYEAGTGKILVRDRFDLDLDLEPTAAPFLQRQRFDASVEATARQEVERLVLNPEALGTYERRIGVLVESERRGFRPTQAPSLEGSPVENVIITSQALAANFQVLADWKTQRGVPTVVRTLEWIQANYQHGSDLQETVRNFIRSAYSLWSSRFVLLGGDTDVVPARYGYSEFGPETDRYIPTDMYFACLDGNWNSDGDALWGEAAIPTDTPVDEPDLYAEVFVGRLPVSTPAEAGALISKIIQYEAPSVTTYQDEMLFLSEVLFPVDWAPGQVVIEDGADYSEYGLLPLVSPSTTVTKLYQNYTAFTGAGQLTLQSTLSALAAGPGFVNHIGHGFRYNMSVGDVSMLTHHAVALNNTTRRFVLYMLNCTATAFDFPCLAESYLDAPGGAVAVLGSTRAAFPLPSRNYNVGFFQAMYDGVVAKNVGVLFTASRLPYTPYAYYDTSDHYTHFLYNLLGDPEMVVHTSNLQSTAVTAPASLGLGLTQVQVTVTTNGVPRANALVCLQKGTEEYEHGRTDGAGQVTLAFVAETPGSAVLTASGQNMTTWVSTLPVNASVAPYVHVQNLVVDDDNNGGTVGNGDGRIDSGETVALDLTFANSGNGAASGVSGVLRLTSPWATVQDSTYTVGNVGSGGSVLVSGPVRFAVSASAPDGAVLACRFASTNGSATWNDTVNRVLHAPGMQLVLVDVLDPAPGGNNDGTIQAGETFDLVPSFKNYGSGAAIGLQSTLLSSDPDIVLTVNNISVGTAAPLQELVAANHFRLQENSLQENPLTLQLVDTYGHMKSWNLTLRGPVAPDAPVLDPSQGSTVMVCTWTPSVEPDLAGYHLYRSQTGLPPWTRVTLDRTNGVAYYRDSGLTPSTKYFYYVSAVDSSGNESAPSPLASANTSPSQLAGWPIQMAAVSSCPPAVGDITGDGNKDIVAGNLSVYAWDWQGIELRDDDADPQTWGIFANEVGTVTAAVVMAQLDPAPGLEAFVTAWGDAGDGTKAIVLRGDGSIPTGWPQDPAPASVPPGYWGSPAAVDLDGDGYAELFAPAKNGNLYAWHRDGTPVGASAAFKSGLGTWSRCSPTFANLDGDPQPEIVYAAPTGTLWIWNANGTSLPRFPMNLGNVCLSSTAIGDVDGDGDLDVVMVSENDSLYVIDPGKGKRLPGWPVYLSVESNPVSPSPALADFDADGDLEIVIANNAVPTSQCAVRVYSHTGQVLPGWPRFVDAHTSESSPIVADFSGDGVPDIVFGNENGLMYGWDRNGNTLPGFPLTVGGEVRSTPFATDIDGDGHINLILAGWDQNLWVWDFTAPYSAAAAQWPTFKHDVQRTGYYGHTATSPTDAPASEERQVPRRAFLGQNVPNPFNPMTSVPYGVPALAGAAKVPVRIEVFDVRGRSVRRLLEGEQAPGTYEALWDGRDDHGRAVQSGVYFFRLRVASDTHVRKAMLLR